MNVSYIKDINLDVGVNRAVKKKYYTSLKLYVTPDYV